MSASDIRLAHLWIVEVGKFVSFVIQFIPHVDKELAIWLQGMCHLLLLFYFSRGTAPEQRLLEKLKRVGMDPHEYTFSRFQSPFAVYLKAPSRNWSIDSMCFWGLEFKI